MKLSLVRVSSIGSRALGLCTVGLGAIALSIVGATASCAVAESEPMGAAPPGDAGASVPDAASDPGDAASPEAGPRTCSVHGICRTTLPPDETLRGVWGDGAGVVWAVSDAGHVLRWDGSAWKVHASVTGALSTIWGSGPTDVWVGGEGGVFHGTGASSSALVFQESALPGGPARVASIWGASADDVWAVGTTQGDGGETTGSVLHHAGAGWSLDPASTIAAKYTHVWGGAGTGVWIGGTRPIQDEPFDQMIVLRSVGGAPFAPITLPDDPEQNYPFGVPGTIHGVAVASSSLVWIVGRTTVGLPGIWKGTSPDSGQTFTFAYAPDGRPDDPEWRSLAATSPNVAWAVGEYGRMRRWDGSAWGTVAVTTTNVPMIDPLYAVWSSGPDEVWAVGAQVALRLDPTKKDGGSP